MKKDKEWLRKESKKHYYLKDLGVSSEPKIMAREIENLIDQLDEPELPVIPQFVADHIKYFKEDTLTLGDALDTHYGDNRKMHTWLYENIEARNDEVFARAWLDSYTIEQPKLLTVIVKDYDKTIMSKQMTEDEVDKMMEGM